LKPTLAVWPDKYEPRTPINVRFTGGPGNPADWIGLYKSSESDQKKHIAWQYVNGSQKMGEARATGNLSFVGLDSGSYEARFFADNGHDVLASDNFRISSTSTFKSQAEMEEDYRKWKEGDGHSAHMHEYLAESDSGRYRFRLGSGFTFFEQWKLKLGISAMYTGMLLIPYFSYWLWFVLLPPLTFMPGAPSILRGMFAGDWDINGIFGKWVFFDEVGPPALFVPSLFGALFFLGYFYILNNIFIPKYKPKQHLVLSLLWILSFLRFAFGW